MKNFTHALALLAGIIIAGGAIKYILQEPSEPPAAPPALVSKAIASEPSDPLADAAMKKLDEAFPGSPGAEPPGMVIFGQSGARYLFSPDTVAEFSGRNPAAPSNANVQTYVVRVTGNSIAVDTNNSGTATTVVLTLPPPGTVPGKAPPLSVTTKNTAGATKTLAVPVAEYARGSGLLKVAPNGAATFVLPDNNVAVKHGRVYNSNASNGSSVILDSNVTFSNNTTTR